MIIAIYILGWLMVRQLDGDVSSYCIGWILALLARRR